MVGKGGTIRSKGVRHGTAFAGQGAPPRTGCLLKARRGFGGAAFPSQVPELQGEHVRSVALPVLLLVLE
jgi:hypothetical protein